MISKTDQRNAFWKSVFDGDAEAVVAQLDRDPALAHAYLETRLTDLDNPGASALHIACARGYWDVVFYLLRRGADSNACDDVFRTPLSVAVEYGQRECADYLLMRGADVEGMPSSTTHGSYPSVADLREAHAEYGVPTPLQTAVLRDDEDIVSSLLARGADHRARYEDGSSLLWVALPVVKRWLRTYGALAYVAPVDIHIDSPSAALLGDRLYRPPANDLHPQVPSRIEAPNADGQTFDLVGWNRLALPSPDDVEAMHRSTWIEEYLIMALGNRLLTRQWQNAIVDDEYLCHHVFRFVAQGDLNDSEYLEFMEVVLFRRFIHSVQGNS